MSLDNHLEFLDCISKRAGVRFRDVASSYHLIKRMASEEFPRLEWDSRRLRLLSYNRLLKAYEVKK